MKACLPLLGLFASCLLLQACDNNSNHSSRPVVPEPEVQLMAGAASRSILPTVNGGRDYLADAPGYPSPGKR
ncbi:MAG: hypothetical protein OEW92_13965 [Gammaproteobacteria bacterium]|nr:hypothetical protein [Gammaproteobacteria bacterium]